MSQLDQAKKEAKRLFNLAKNYQEKNVNFHSSPYISIENLSKAKEILSMINGYQNWHEYESTLKKKDFLSHQIDKNSIYQEQKEIHQNQSYYIQNMDFHTIHNSQNYQKTIVLEQEHTPITLGRAKEKYFFEYQEKTWLLNEYPVLVVGMTGSGKSETLLSMTSQYLKNKEGVIYFENNGSFSTYVKIFNYARQYHRLQDLYCLNFLTSQEDCLENKKEILEEKTSHSIDPINPMLGNLEYFQHFFGRLGIVIHSILEEIHQKNQSMDIESLESILMLNNLIQWHQNQTFHTPEIAKYLTEIGFPNSQNNDDFHQILTQHATQSHAAYKTISLLKKYSHIFQLNASVSMEKIFLKRKILVVLLPIFSRDIYEVPLLGHLISYQIQYFEKQYQNYAIHFQNILINEFPNITSCFKDIDFQKTKNNYVFSCTDYQHNTPVFDYLLKSTKTYVLMKYEQNLLPEWIRLQFLNLRQFPKFKNNFHSSFIQKFMNELKKLTEGQAYILSQNYKVNHANIINNNFQYYCSFIQCEYIPSPYNKKLEISIIQHNQSNLPIQKEVHLSNH